MGLSASRVSGYPTAGSRIAQMEMSFRVKTVIFSTLVVARGLVPLDLHPRLIFLFSNVFLHSDRVPGVFRFAFRNAFSPFLLYVFSFMFA